MDVAKNSVDLHKTTYLALCLQQNTCSLLAKNYVMLQLSEEGKREREREPTIGWGLANANNGHDLPTLCDITRWFLLFS